MVAVPSLRQRIPLLAAQPEEVAAALPDVLEKPPLQESFLDARRVNDTPEAEPLNSPDPAGPRPKAIRPHRRGELMTLSAVRLAGTGLRRHRQPRGRVPASAIAPPAISACGIACSAIP